MSERDIQLETKVYTYRGNVFIYQFNGPDKENDIVRIEPEHIDALMQSILKAKRQLESE